jgi:3-oxoadipate enol-lactonase
MAGLADALVARWFAASFAQREPAAYRGYRNMLARMPVEGYLATCATLRDADLREVVQTIQAPALVLCGDEDVATPPSVGRALAEALPHARFALIEQAGHLPCIEQPAALAAQLDQFLREVHDG